MSRCGAGPSLVSLASLHVIAMLAAIAASTGCLPSLVAESSAPPGRAARLDADAGFWGTTRYRLELSQGVALAISCDHGGPCEKLVATSDNPAIAEVRLASLAALRPAGYLGNHQPAAAMVVVGKAPGATTIRVRTKAGGRDLPVTVVSPPAPPRPSAVTDQEPIGLRGVRLRPDQPPR